MDRSWIQKTLYRSFLCEPKIQGHIISQCKNITAWGSSPSLNVSETAGKCRKNIEFEKVHIRNADCHSPVADEYLYVYGFLALMPRQVSDNTKSGGWAFLAWSSIWPKCFYRGASASFSEHISCAWSTNLASPLMGTTETYLFQMGWVAHPCGIPDIPGYQCRRYMDPLWLSHYRNSRGHSAKMTRLFATPVESFKDYFLSKRISYRLC